jgi:hypothetical protein
MIQRPDLPLAAFSPCGELAYHRHAVLDPE